MVSTYEQQCCVQYYVRFVGEVSYDSKGDNFTLTTRCGWQGNLKSTLVTPEA